MSTTTDIAPGIGPRIVEAAARLGLDRLGTAVMSLAAAPEIDPRFGRLFAHLNDDANQRLATPRLLVVSGADAAALLARALGCGLIVVSEPDRDAELAAALEDRPASAKP